jgi:hypothetical protein
LKRVTEKQLPTTASNLEPLGYVPVRYRILHLRFYSSHVCPTALVGGVAVVGGGCRGDVD